MLAACIKAPFLLKRPPLYPSFFTRLAHSADPTSRSTTSSEPPYIFKKYACDLRNAALELQPRPFEEFNDSKRFNGKFKYLVYSSIIKDLLNSSYFPEASFAFKTMQPIFHSPSMKARMLASAIAKSFGDPHERLIIPFVFLSAHKDMTEDIFTEIMQMLARRKVKPKVLLQLINYYITAQNDGFVPAPELAAIWFRAKFLTEGADAALVALKEYSMCSTNTDLLPYTTLLSTINDVSLDDAGSVEQILLIMDHAQLTLDLTVFNALLRREHRLKHSSSAFTVYASLKEMADSGVLPNEETYAMLFSLLRSRRPRVSKRPPSGFYPPRSLFRDMIDTTMHPEHPLVLSSSLLTVALRAFLKHRDYPAALVAVNTFDQHHIDVPIEAYYVAVKHIVHRIWAEVCGKRVLGSKLWCDHFLGSSAATSIRDVEALEEQLSEGLVDKILNFTRQDKMSILNVRFLRSIPTEVPVYSAPTLAELEQAGDPPPEVKYHSKPLERLLERAIVATFIPQHRKGLKDAVQVARAEMTPPT